MHRLRLGARIPIILVVQAALVAGSAQAQAIPQAQAVLAEVIVTGSRIRRVEGQPATVPIVSVSAEELNDQGDISLGDALNDLPALRATFGQANSSRFIGTAGLNWLDLRGLGVERTLVLVNNRRHVTSSPGDYFVDVNTIPSDLVERVDIVTGGNSAVYDRCRGRRREFRHPARFRRTATEGTGRHVVRERSRFRVPVNCRPQFR